MDSAGNRFGASGRNRRRNGARIVVSTLPLVGGLLLTQALAAQAANVPDSILEQSRLVWSHGLDGAPALSVAIGLSYKPEQMPGVLDTTALRTTIEEVLRAAGVAVATDAQAGAARVVFELSLLPIRTTDKRLLGYSYTYTLDVVRMVSLGSEIGSSRMPAITWIEIGFIRTVDRTADINKELKHWARAAAEELAKAYFVANPRG